MSNDNNAQQPPVRARMLVSLEKLMAHVTKTHTMPTGSPMWYVYAGHTLMKNFETRNAAEEYMQSGGIRYVATVLCQHEMGPPPPSET